MSAPDRISETLQAYHDGELTRLARWRMDRRLARDPELRLGLEALGNLGDLIREVDSEAPTPDLWPTIEARLSARRELPATESPDWSAWWVRPLGAGLAAVAAGLLVVGLWPQDPEMNRVVRWLDTNGKPVMVLQGDPETTIIWVLDTPPNDEARRSSHAV